MTDIILKEVRSGYNTSTINENFTKIQEKINSEIVHNTGLNNIMNQMLDMNGNALLNVGIIDGEEIENSVEYIIQQLLEYNNPIGTVRLYANTHNPNDDLPGTWARIADDVSVYSQASDIGLGVITGDDSRAIPLLEHSHGASFVGSPLAGHAHYVGVVTDGIGDGTNYAPGDPYAISFTRGDASSDSNYNMSHDSTARLADAALSSNNSAGTPSGSVSVTSTGDVSPTIDVKPRRIPLALWQRTA